ncbi:MAG: hypothetical protein J1E35_02460 [Lachnospiraceae bacterium]|nr:hypothetical protein [Lachnospiraceae bacterium]
MSQSNHYYVSVGSPLLEGKRYGRGQFLSPLKDLREQRMLVENSKENKNDSYRQRTKYDDRADCYYSTYDMESLLYNRDSYLEGKLNSADDVDCYSFSYRVRPFYEKMGVVSKITIRMETVAEGCDYDLVVYDKAGNQIGIAKKNDDGSRELSLPDWDHGTEYVIRVENRNGSGADTEGTYRLRIAEEKIQTQAKAADTVQSGNSDAAETKTDYTEEVERLHEEQYRALPEEERYQGGESVEELLKRLASGGELSRQEKEYLKIYANLHDYERAEAAGRVRNKLYPEIIERLREEGIELSGKEWELELDASGKAEIIGDLTGEEKERIAGVLEKEFADSLWDCYMQASDMDAQRYKQVSAYREVSSFLEKATGGRYTWENIYIDSNGKISGLPDRLCELLNSQESNGKYEQLRDEIFILWDAKQRSGKDDWYDFRVKYRTDGTTMELR